MKSLYASVFILIYLIVKSSGLPLRRTSQELFLSEVIRVRRQAGYVYNKPSVSFDLPPRATSSTVTIQAPTVDRTQAQMMYYAYPVPATGSNVGASAGPTIGVGDASTTPGSAGISSGYNYGTQNALSSPQSVSTSGSSQTRQSSSASSSGYGYNVPVSNGSAQKSSNTDSSGYGYNAPSVGVAQVSNSVKSVQTNNVGSSQTGSVAGAGYEYNIPANTQSSGVAPTIDVSTNAPKYLPPSSGGGNSNDITYSSVQTGDESSGIVSGISVTVTQPLDQYLPPLISKPDSPAATVVDQYLPPIRQSESSAPAPRTPAVNKEVQSDSVARPNSSYIPPNLDQSPLLSPNFTPRPFSSAPLTDGYLPPIPNSQASAPNSPSTPASPYLPPVF